MKNIDPEAIHSERGVVRYWQSLRDVARQNRRSPTKAEEMVWKGVLSGKKTGYIFLRQKPIHRFIVDFYCSEKCLAIEIDGDSHDKKEIIDRMRDRLLVSIGIVTIRFTNDEVVSDLGLVKKKILASLVKGRSGGIGC